MKIEQQGRARRRMAITAVASCCFLVMAAMPANSASFVRFAEDCHEPIHITAGTIGTLKFDAWQHTGTPWERGTHSWKYYSWVDYPNPNRTVNMLWTTVAEIQANTSRSSWVSYPYLICG